jgi:hypothetical protein
MSPYSQAHPPASFIIKVSPEATFAKRLRSFRLLLILTTNFRYCRTHHTKEVFPLLLVLLLQISLQGESGERLYRVTMKYALTLLLNMTIVVAHGGRLLKADGKPHTQAASQRNTHSDGEPAISSQQRTQAALSLRSSRYSFELREPANLKKYHFPP